MKKLLRTLVTCLLAICMLLSCTAIAEGDADKFYIYAFGTDLENYLTLVYERYPELKDKIVYVNCGSSDTFQEKIDILLKTTDAEDYPDMITLEGGFIMKYTNSDYTLDVSKIGITEEDLSDMYQYMVDLAKDPRDGSVKALSWQACPGVFYYNEDVAKEYLGIETPEEMAAAINGWDNFLDTARKLKEASGDKVRILSSNDDIYYLFVANKETPWVDADGVFHNDSMMEQYMITWKTLVDEGLTWGAASWGEEWYASMSNGNVLGYMGPTWFSGQLENNTGDTYGHWKMCEPTVPYYWGGTWVAATSGCTDYDTARKIMDTVCINSDWMTRMAEDFGEFPNNQTAVQNMVDSGKSGKALLGGQDFYGYFGEMAKNVDVSFVSAYDTKANELGRVQVAAYAAGTKTLEQALADFEDAFAEAFPTVKFE